MSHYYKVAALFISLTISTILFTACETVCCAKFSKLAAATNGILVMFSAISVNILGILITSLSASSISVLTQLIGRNDTKHWESLTGYPLIWLILPFIWFWFNKHFLGSHIFSPIQGLCNCHVVCPSGRLSITVVKLIISTWTLVHMWYGPNEELSSKMNKIGWVVDQWGWFGWVGTKISKLS